MRSAARRWAVRGLAFLLAAATAAAEPDRPGKPNAPSTSRQLLPVERAILLDGRPFPRRSASRLAPAPSKRTFYAKPGAAGGDGSEKKPWGDLEEALRTLEPGDRLILGKGSYVGAFRVDDSCRDGNEEAPIELVGKEATIRAEGDAPALALARRYWWLEGLRFAAKEPGQALVRIERGAEHVTIDDASLRPGSRAGLELAGPSGIVVANTRVLYSGRGRIETPAIGVAIGSGSRDVRFEGLLVVGSGGSGLRVGEESGDPPSSVSIISSTVRDTLGPALRIVSGRDVLVTASDFFQSATGRLGTSEGIRVEGGHGVRITECRLGDFALAVRIGVRAAENGASAPTPEEIVLERSFLESRSGRGAGVAVEAGRDVRISNNLLSGFEEAFVVFGSPPITERLAVVNNLAIGISRLAFRLEGRDPERVFDYNVFSTAQKGLEVEIDGKTLELSAFLRKKSMPHTKLAYDVTLLHGDLGAVRGVETVDRGKPLAGIPFQGKAPDIGIAER